MSYYKLIATKAYELSTYINKALSLICQLLFLLILIIVIVGVFYRYVLRSPLGWTTEVSRYLLVWGGLLAISIVLYEKNHIAINFILNSLPEKLRLVLNIVFRVLIAYFFYILIYYGIQMSERALTQSIPTLNISVFWVFVAIPVTSFISLVQLILTSLSDIPGNNNIYNDDF